MTQIITRPHTTHAPGEGLLRAEHFQVAYVTNDVQRACEVFRERYGVDRFSGLDANTPAGGSLHIELAWVGGLMIELIQASGPGTAFYTDRLPSDGFAIRHHHFGYLVQDLKSWEKLAESIKHGGWTVPLEGHTAGFMRFFYVESKELGHYLEYFLLEEAGVAFFESVRAN